MNKKLRLSNNSDGFGSLVLIGLLMLAGIVGVGLTVYKNTSDISLASNKAFQRSSGGCLDVADLKLLQDAINKNSCVRLAAGTWNIDKYIILPSGHTLKGFAQDKTIIKASPAWISNGVEGLVDVRSEKAHATIQNLTLDAANLATYAMATKGVMLDHVTLTAGKCSALGVTGKNLVLSNSLITKSGFVCSSSPPGAGIYMQATRNTDKSFGPRITGTTIKDNNGPGIDVNNVNGGTLSRNMIIGNSGWAAVSLYAASNWTIDNNTLHQPMSTFVQPYHTGCAQHLPNGNGSAGLLICRDTTNTTAQAQNNRISNNGINGRYGIVLIGDGTTNGNSGPQRNVFTNNNVNGSTFGCVDSLKYAKTNQKIKNVWNGNNCNGTKNSQPQKF